MSGACRCLLTTWRRHRAGRSKRVGAANSSGCASAFTRPAMPSGSSGRSNSNSSSQASNCDQTPAPRNEGRQQQLASQTPSGGQQQQQVEPAAPRGPAPTSSMKAGSTSCASGRLAAQGEDRPRLCPTTCRGWQRGAGRRQRGAGEQHSGQLVGEAASCPWATEHAGDGPPLAPQARAPPAVRPPSGTLCSSRRGSSGLVGLHVSCRGQAAAGRGGREHAVVSANEPRRVNEWCGQAIPVSGHASAATTICQLLSQGPVEQQARVH